METKGSPERAKSGFGAMFGEQQRFWRNLFNLPRVVETARKTRVGASERTVVLEERTHTLLHYRRETRAAYAEPVLLCYALVNRPYILDLQPDKSVVRQYLRRGFDVYMIDWGVPSDVDRALTLHDYVDGFLAKAVDFVRDRHDRAPVHLVGYCMGGTLSALYGALHPHALATLTLLAAPIDFGGRESLLNLWTDVRTFDVDAFVDAHGNCPAWFLQSCFLAMNPIRNIVDKAIAFYEQMDDPRSVENHFALERWINDNIPVAGETFREFVGKLYQRNELVRGELRLGGERVDLGRVTCPVLLLTAKSDHLVAPTSTEGIRPHLGSRDVTSMSLNAGHVGLVVGGKAHDRFWPEATSWTAERSTAPAPRTTTTTTTRRTVVVHEPRWWALGR